MLITLGISTAGYVTVTPIKADLLSQQALSIVN